MLKIFKVVTNLPDSQVIDLVTCMTSDQAAQVVLAKYIDYSPVEIVYVISLCLIS